MKKLLAALSLFALTAQAPLPAGFLLTSGNQITDGQANNVRLACVQYDNGTGSLNDFAALRSAGFNCARISYYDKTFQTNGFSSMDTFAANAAATGMRIVWVHAGNEGAYGSGPCATRQANGLPYDLNSGTPVSGITFNTTNGTDGCGTTGTINYAQFKANWVSIAGHFASNPTVIGFDLHNEPVFPVSSTLVTTQPNWGGSNGSDLRFMYGDVGNAIRSVNTGAIIFVEGLVNNSGTFLDGTTMISVGGAGANGFQDLSLASTKPIVAPSTGSFTASNGQVIGPDGNVFHASGMNIVGRSLSNLPSSVVLNLFPQTNIIRVAVGGDCDPPGGYLCNDTSNSQILSSIADYTSHNIVMMIESHWVAQPNANTLNLSGEYTWYNTLAQATKGNIYVWYESGNELGQPGLTAEHNNVYHAVRDAGNNTVVVGTSATGNDFLDGGTPDGPASTYNSYTNFLFGQHAYNWMPCGHFGGNNNGNNACLSSINVQSNVDSIFSQAVTAAKNYTHDLNGNPIGTLYSESGFNDYANVCGGNNGPGTLTNSFSCGSGQTVTSALTAARTGAVGGVGWLAYYPRCCSWQTDFINQSNTSQVFSPYGTYVQTIIANGSSGQPTAGTTGGAAVPKVVYATHVFPTNVSTAVPDSGSGFVPMLNKAFGNLIISNTAAVWVGGGASLDNSNGALTAENAWASALTAYLNGTASGGPTFTGLQQTISNNWYAWGNLSPKNPNGTLNPDLSPKTGQQAVYVLWEMPQTNTLPGVQTTWNPSDIDSNTTLSNSNFTATSTANVATGTRSTTSKSSGKFCADIVISTFTADLDVGFANSTYALNNPSGLGVDTNGIGFDPNSTGGNQGIFFNNVVLSSNSGVTSAPGTLTMCADFDAKVAWFTSSEMRAAGTNWNNDPTASPAGGTGGASFSGMTGPYFLIFNDIDSGAVATISAGTTAVTLPSGFSLWDTPVVQTTHGQGKVLAIQ